MNNRYILMGPPGVGKGTQAVKLAKHFNIPHISTGDIFRDHFKRETELGKLAKTYTDKGLLVPDSLTNDLIVDRLNNEDCKNGFILDGYPRNIEQAKFLDEFLKSKSLELRYAINLTAGDNEIIKRLSGRRVCPTCGSIYHVDIIKPKVENKCDKCNIDLIIRKDDTIEVISNRLKVYNQTFKPLLAYYQDKNIVKEIQTSKPLDVVFEEILVSL